MSSALKTCARCGASVEGRLDFIDVTFLCVRCCMRGNRSQKPVHGCFYITSENWALQNCDISEQELQRLNFMSLTEKGASEVVESRQYLTGEVRYLRNLRRKEELEQASGIDLKNVDARLRDYLLGDYLSELSEAEMDLDRVHSRCSVLLPVTETLKRYPSECPEAVFEFFVDSPTAGPDGYMQRKWNMIAVFQLEGYRILHGIPPQDREKLRQTPLDEIYESFKRLDSDAMIGGYLLKWFTKGTISLIMKEEGWRSRPWATGPEDRVAESLKKFWKERARRKEKLEKTLAEKKTQLHEDSPLYKDYVNGDSAYRLKEVVAIADLNHLLGVEWEIESGSSKGQAALRELLYNLNELKVGHFLSVRRAVEAGVEYPITDEESDNEEEEEEDDEY